jgi:polyisoprenoid-binding protein YceI
VIRPIAVLATTLLVAAAASAEAADWKMDAATSHLEFAAAFERTVALGVFREFDARMHFDVLKPAEARLDVAIIMKSANMNSADMNKAIGGAEWFDLARFPQADFHAAEISRTDAGRYLARGTLRVKGVQQPVEVPFSRSEGSDAARLEGEFIVKRSVFGIGTGEWAATNVIGADVKVKFSVRMRKSG